MITSLSLPVVLMTMVVDLAAAQTPPAPGAASAIACRALEVHTDAKEGVTIVVFHQRDDQDRSRVGALLRGRDGTVIEFRTSDGVSHPATLIRLKSCFGRGLLLFRAGATRIGEKDEFLLVEPTSAARQP